MLNRRVSTGQVEQADEFEIEQEIKLGMKDFRNKFRNQFMLNKHKGDNYSVIERNQLLHLKRRLSVSNKSFVCNQADEDFGNGLIGFGEVIKVPHGKWKLRFKQAIFMLEQSANEIEVEIEFQPNGRLIYDKTKNKNL